MKNWKQAIGSHWSAFVDPWLTEDEDAVIAQLWEEVVGRPDVFPPCEAVFAAFTSQSPDDVRVVILGQDPYHGPGQAHGLAFSVRHGVKVPPSLRNMLKELATDVSPIRWREEAEGTGLLSGWSQQGVMLLNTALTVESGRAGSHRGRGWEALTKAAVQGLAEAPGSRVFLLWGKPAAAFASLIHRPEHLVLEAPHPSPLSAHRGFFGSRPFSQANRWLEQHGQPPVDWWRGIPNR